MPVVMSIAGYDPSSGAGITADVKTAAAHGCYATTCLTAITVQTTEKVFTVEPVRGEIVRDTLYELARDMPPAAVRIGMLGTGEVADAVAEFLEFVKPPNVVLDPVLRSSSGAALLDSRGEVVLRERLLKVADVCTPNIDEASLLVGRPAAGSEAELPAIANGLHHLGCKGVVVTGGHLAEAADLLSWGGGQEWLRGAKLVSRATHGTGCAFAMAIACNLAKGLDLLEAVRGAKEFVRTAIATAEPLGHGSGPMKLI